MELVLLSRSYCHLCHDMADALEPILAEFQATLSVLDIDEHPEWLEQYDEWVPVLLHDGMPLCHYHLDEPKVREYLKEVR